ncbi:MAG TPA: hypothetical protein VGM87_13890 [Roseomonas sp.]|jgi:hypothetical protein
MPFDPDHRPPPALPLWLRPETIQAIAAIAEGAGAAPAGYVRGLARDFTRARFPALSAPEIEEAVALGLWAAGR